MKRNDIEYPIMLDDRDKGYGVKLTDLCPTQRAERFGIKVIENCGENLMNKELRIRKLTPKECMRLMGFTDEDYQALVECGLSDSAIFHMCGDSIITTVLVSIFSPFINEENAHIKIVENYTEKDIVKIGKSTDTMV